MSARCLRCGAGNEWIEGTATIKADLPAAPTQAGAQKFEHGGRTMTLREIADAEYASPPADAKDVSAQYYELLYAVCNKYPNESRHETALRYIRNAENQTHGPDAATQASKEGSDALP